MRNICFDIIEHTNSGELLSYYHEPSIFNENRYWYPHKQMKDIMEESLIVRVFGPIISGLGQIGIQNTMP